MYTRYLPVPANAQLKPAAVSPDFRHWQTLPRNSPFSAAMRPVSAAKTAHFGKQNGTFRNSLTACRLAKAALTGYFNIKMAMAVRVDRRARGARAVCGCSKKNWPGNGLCGHFRVNHAMPAGCPGTAGRGMERCRQSTFSIFFTVRPVSLSSTTMYVPASRAVTSMPSGV